MADGPQRWQSPGAKTATTAAWAVTEHDGTRTVAGHPRLRPGGLAGNASSTTWSLLRACAWRVRYSTCTDRPRPTPLPLSSCQRRAPKVPGVLLPMEPRLGCAGNRTDQRSPPAVSPHGRSLPQLRVTLPERRWLAHAKRQLTFSKAAGRPGARSREFGPVRGARFAVVVTNGRLTRDA